MRVLFVTSVYPRSQEDSEVPWLRESVNRLRQKGIESDVLAPAFRGRKSHRIDGARVYRFRYGPPDWETLTHDEGAPSKIANQPWRQLLAIPYILMGFVRCLELAHRNRYQLLHVHWPFPHGLIAFGAASLFRIPMVFHFHGASLLLMQKKPWIRPILQFLIPRCQAVVTNSSYTANRVREVYRHPVLEVLPYGATVSPTSSPQKDAPSGGVLRLLFVGRHIERKGTEYLIAAMETLVGENVRLTIVGEGDRTAALKQKAQRISSQAIRFTGKLSSARLGDAYANADIFVLPAIIDSRGDTEGLGVVLLEAIAYGLPIIASNVGGIPDVVLHEQTGLLVEQKNPQQIVDAVRRLRSDPEFARQVRQNASKHASHFFDWERITERQVGLYRQMI